jgi:hypothetical protein
MVLITLLSGEKKDFAVSEASALERSNLLKTHLKLKDFMNASKDKTQETNVFDFLKNEDGMLDFVNDVLKIGFKTLDLNMISGDEADKLSTDYFGKILGFDKKN